ncbi:uncharacterized protein LOC128668411 [Microplitis demolitor]|uniref:uncharacterized protein LOC128668411 n=1 Tax=Microplitis demolitor TaxID=69319 RepID=UPI00235B6A36|nr:uncharacterized protein LOC128668411 [Microplitis demolitor]
MTLMTRYVDPDSLMIRTELIQLIHVNATDCCATKLLEEYTNGLEQNKIPLDNLIGLTCDNAPVMVGINHSFQKHLTKRLPHLLTIPYICHSLALIARDACKAAIPAEIDEIISGIPNFVNGSPKRLAEFAVFQEGFNQKSKLLRIAPTKWLSRQIAISRILDNWGAMLSYLTEKSFMNNVAGATKLLSIMNNPVTKAYLLFLKFALDSLEKMNAQFQSSETLVHKLQPSSKKSFDEVLQRFMKPDLFVTG